MLDKTWRYVLTLNGDRSSLYQKICLPNPSPKKKKSGINYHLSTDSFKAKMILPQFSYHTC